MNKIQIFENDVLIKCEGRCPEKDDEYSWFDYRSKGFEDIPKRGLRIDHIWVTKKLNSVVKESGIDYDIRGMEKPSDHAPIWTQFEL